MMGEWVLNSSFTSHSSYSKKPTPMERMSVCSAAAELSQFSLLLKSLGLNTCTGESASTLEFRRYFQTTVLGTHWEY